jgi:hypothetical protein
MYTISSNGAIYDPVNDLTLLYLEEALVDDIVGGIVEKWGE